MTRAVLLASAVFCLVCMLVTGDTGIWFTAMCVCLVAVIGEGVMR